MISKFTKTLNKITWKHWILFLLSSQGIYFIMLTQTLPYIQKEAGNLKVFDLQSFGYSFDYAKLFLSSLSVNGYYFYRIVQLLILDLLYPILNCGLAISTFILLIRFYVKIYNKEIKRIYSLIYRIVLLLPICAMLFDYLENILILIMLSIRSEVNPIIVAISSSFTIVKSMSTLLFYIITILIIVMIFIMLILNKFRSKNLDGERKLKGKKEGNIEESDNGRNA